VAFLSAEEIREKRDEIQTAFAELMKTKMLAGKPGAAQWKFFRSCFNTLLMADRTAEKDFCELSSVRAAQLKFEVEDRLRRFYLHPGKPLRYIFAIVHASQLHNYVLVNGEPYPSFAGYCVLVREYSVADASGVGAAGGTTELKPYLERVVAECIDAEFRAYAALPEIALADLEKWFYPDSPAMREIMTLLKRHKERGWIINNPLNPSNKCLLRIKVHRVDAKECLVHTTEYWYLRWWDMGKNACTYPYRETNTQVYILKKSEGAWKVYQNLRPSPRSSAPHRRAKVVK
jgi:hypothetical protein